MRLAVAVSVILLASPAAGKPRPDEPEKGNDPKLQPEGDDRKLQPEDGLPKPDADDLRAGHWLIAAGGGVWVPSPSFTPGIPALGAFDAAGAVDLRLGVGLDRYVVLGVDGGYARLVGASCDGCSANSFDVGASLSFFIAQGFAFEPWASYGVGYRHTSIALGGAPGHAFHALEVARLAIGGSYFPIASLGFGPYVGTDLGFRDFGAPVFYAAFDAGLRLTFDPVRIGTTLRPQVATR
jgi:hypothetical protein